MLLSRVDPVIPEYQLSTIGGQALLTFKEQCVIAYGIDYLRVKVFGHLDIEHIRKMLPYLDIDIRSFHGGKFVDLTGKQLEMVRSFDSVEDVVRSLLEIFPIHRLDAYVDIGGDWVSWLPRNGTVIMNDGLIETVYTHNLGSRGDVPIFGRAYDARAARHYNVPSTRFEIEFKRETAKDMVDLVHGFNVNPVRIALYWIGSMFDVAIAIDGLAPVEFKGITKRLAHSRERFYTRYGKNILLDIQKMGVTGLHEFIRECIGDENDGNGREKERNRNHSERWGRCQGCAPVE